MANYRTKSVALSHNATEPVTILSEVDFSGNAEQWSRYAELLAWYDTCTWPSSSFRRMNQPPMARGITNCTRVMVIVKPIGARRGPPSAV
jgi:hypothetical protein